MFKLNAWLHGCELDFFAAVFNVDWIVFVTARSTLVIEKTKVWHDGHDRICKSIGYLFSAVQNLLT